MVGQRFITLMEHHPWFQLTAIAASARSAGKPYAEAVAGRWALDVPMPEEAKNLVVLDAEQDAERLASMVDFCFCAVDMKKEEIRALEEKYARLECPIVSNNSAHRWTDDVPMVVPRSPRGPSGGDRGPAQAPGHPPGLHRREEQLFAPELRPGPAPPEEVRPGQNPGLHLSGHLRRGKTFQRWPEMVDNCIPTSAARRRRASRSR